jgi:hypothetical protein
VLVLAHRDELIEQGAAKIRTVNPHLRVGIVKAERDEVGADVIVASVQTLRNDRRLRRVRGIGTVVVDECHHATAPSYRAVIEHYDAVTVGFTATMTRADRVALGDIWQDVVYSRDIASMIRDGYLVGVRGIRVVVPDLDLRKVKRSRGDYADGALGDALEGSLAPEKVAQAYREHAPELQGILFAPTVSAAYAFAQALEAEGFSVGVVHGELPAGERRQRLQDFRDGKIQILSNCMVLTEGTDLPMATVAVIARPTQNQGLYIQMVGRVLRPHPGKGRALVLDVAGATAHHTLMSPVQLFGAEPAEKIDRDLLELDDETLELDEDDNETGGPDAPIYLTGEIEAVEVDLFHGSASSWLRTYAGVWFLPAGERLICIVPSIEPGLFDVVWVIGKSVPQSPGSSGWVARGCADLSYAMAYAEGDVTAEEQRVAMRERSWRVTKPSEAQKGYAQRLGIIVTPDMTKGEASNLISIAAASLRIDRYLPPHIRRG